MTELHAPAPGAAPLDPDEREGLRLRHITTKRQLDAVEFENMQDGIAWLRRNKTRDPLDEEFVFAFHKKLFGDVWTWAGTTRKTEKNIGIAPHDIRPELRNLIEDARAWRDFATYPPMEATAYFHHRLVKIHSFPNGNGRHARLMADCVLQRAFGSEQTIDWLQGQSLDNIGPHRDRYLVALRAADRGNYALLLAFMGATCGSANIGAGIWGPRLSER